MDPDFDAVEMPLPSLEELAQNESLEGLSDEQLETFRDRAVPQPGALLRGSAELSNSARHDVPTTMFCTSFLSGQIHEVLAEKQAWLAGLAELRDITYVDVPTSHWPMWSRPDDLARLLADVASGG
jgi:hypothetical protein